MKKFLMMMALMLSLVLSVNAQTAIETPKFLDNVYVGIGGQVSTPLDFNGVFPLNSGVTVTLGKEITPVFGFNVEDNVWFGSHANGTHSEFDGVPHFDNVPSHNAIRGNYLGVNGTINLSNLFLGYTGKPRAFELQTVTGLGWWHVFTPHASDRTRDDLGARTGLNLLFNLGNKKAHTIYVQPAVLWNLESPGSNHDNIAFNKMGAQLAVQVGYVYHFKTSNGTHNFKTYDVGAMNNEINRLQAELAKKPNVVVKEIIREKFVPAENTVWVPFAFDKAELTNDAKAILNNLKNVKTVNVDGYASWEDGSNAEHNTALSIARAHTVTEYLKSIGVNVNNSEGHGAEGITSQRCVIVSVVK